MTSLFLLGGFPLNADTEKLKKYISDDLVITSLCNVWVDPSHERRAVFFCSTRFELKKIQERARVKCLDNKNVFVIEEEETKCLYVEVPSMKCKALIDKLPWLFHQKKNGGSKVINIEELKDNKFILTFEKGWGAITEIIESTWFIDNTQVKVTPYFAGFQKKYKEQKQLYLPKKDDKKEPNSFSQVTRQDTLSHEDEIIPTNSQSYRSTPSPIPKPRPRTKEKPIEKELNTNRTLLALFNLFSLKKKCKEKYSNVEISTDLKNGSVCFKGPKSLVDNLEKMLLNQTHVLEDHDDKDELELFLNHENDQPILHRNFQDHKVFAALEEKKDKSIELFVLKDQEKLNFPDFLSSVLVSVQEFPYTKTANEMDKDFFEFLTKFNTKNPFFKLKALGMKKWQLFQFGFLDESEKSCVVNEVRAFLMKMTQPEKTKPPIKSINKKPVLPPKPVKEKLFIHPGSLLALVKCLSFEDKVHEKYDHVDIDIKEKDGLITLNCEVSVFEKLKRALLDLHQEFHSKVDLKDELELFMEKDIDQEHVKEHFQEKQIFIELEETTSGDIMLYVKGENIKKMTLPDFLTSVLFSVQEFPYTKTASEMDKDFLEFLTKFNTKNPFFKLKALGMKKWHLFQFGFPAESEKSCVINEVRAFLIKMTQPEKTKPPIKPVLPPKPVKEQLFIHPGSLLALVKCLSFEDKVHEKDDHVDIDIKEKDGLITLICEVSVFEKLKRALLDLHQEFHSKVDLKEELELFMEKDIDQEHVKEHFQEKQIFIELEETTSGDIRIYVKGENIKKMTLPDFLTSVLFSVQEFPYTKTASEMDKDFLEFLTKFNTKNPFFKLKALGMKKWHLFQFGFPAESEKSCVINEVRAFLIKMTQPEKTKPPIKPVLPPKPVKEQLFIHPGSLLALVKCLSFEDKVHEKDDHVDIDIKEKDGLITLICEVSVFEKLKRALLDLHQEFHSKVDLKEELELFMEKDIDQERVKEHFQEQQIFIELEETTSGDIILYVKGENIKKMTLPEFLTSVLFSVQEFPYTKTASEMDKGFLEFLTKFNTKNPFFKLKALGMKKWQLFQFGFPDESEKSCVVNEIRAFLMKMTQPEKTKAAIKPVLPPKLVKEQLFIHPCSLLALVKCLSFEDKVHEKFDHVDIVINGNVGLITLKCEVCVLGKLKRALLDLHQEFHSKVDLKDELELFMEKDIDQERVKEHFQEQQIVIELEETTSGDIMLYVKGENIKKMTLPEFLTSVLFSVQEFPYTKTASEMDKGFLEFLTKFNTKNPFFKLKALGMKKWQLFQFGFPDESEKSCVVNEIRAFLMKMTQPEKTKAAIKPVLPPKLVKEQLFIHPCSLLALVKCLSFEDKVHEKFDHVDIVINGNVGLITLKCEVCVLGKLKRALLDLHQEFHSKVDLKDELELFMEKDIDQERVKEHFQEQQIVIELEETTSGDIMLYVKGENIKKMTLPEFLTSVLFSVQEFPYTKTANEMDKDFLDFLTEFNEQNSVFKLKVSGTKKWQLFKFGFPAENKKSCVVNEVQAFLEKMTDPKKRKTPVKGKTENPQKVVRGDVFLNPESLLALLKCLSLEEKVQETFDRVDIDINVKDGMITLKGQESVVGKLNSSLFDLHHHFSEVDLKDEFELFFGETKDQERVKEYFQEQQFVMEVEETSSGDIGLIVSGKVHKKKAFQDFVKEVLNKVKDFDLPDANEGLTEALNQFNDSNTLFKLQATRTKWKLFRLGYDDDDRTPIIVKDIETILSKNGSSSDDDDEKYVVASDSLDVVDRSDGNSKRATREQVSLSIIVPQKKRAFFSNHDMFSAMKKMFKPNVTDIVFDNGHLFLYTTEEERSNVFNEISKYLFKVQSECIILNFPGVPEFYRTECGRNLFRKTEQKYKCVLSLDDYQGKHRDQKNANDEQEKTYSTVLGTIDLSGHLNFHLIQGDSRNVTTDASLYICPSDSDTECKGSFPNDKQASLDLPRWFIPKETFDQRKEKQVKVKDCIQTILSQFRCQRVGCISVSVSNKFDNPFPSNVLAKIIIEQVQKEFRYGPIHILVCESDSSSLLKAFQYELTSSLYSGRKRGTTEFLLPKDDIFTKVLSKVFPKKAAPEYDGSTKVKIISSLPFKNMTGKQMVFYPMQSPIDAEMCPLQYEIQPNWRYKRAISDMEKLYPDGLTVGEVHVFDSSLHNDYDVAVYGCQMWGVDVNKALKLTLENCIKAGKLERCDTIFIHIAGTKPPWLYPKHWLAAKWFQHLDSLVTKNNWKCQAEINFVIPDPEYSKIFDSHLKSRLPKTGFFQGFQQKLGFDGGAKKKQSDTAQMKYEGEPCSVTVTAYDKPEVKKIRDFLDTEMKNLMKKNSTTSDLSDEERQKFLTIIKGEDTISWKIVPAVPQKPKKKKGKRKTSADFQVVYWKLTLTGLIDRWVTDIRNAITSKKGESSVDPVRNDQHVQRQVSSSSDKETDQRLGQESDMEADSDDDDNTNSDNYEKKEAQSSGLHVLSFTNQSSVHDLTTGLKSCNEKDAQHFLPPVDNFQWSLFEFKDLSDEEGKTLEMAYRNGNKSCEVTGMRVDFSSMVASSKDDHFKVIRREHLTDKRHEKPANWTDGIFKKLPRQCQEFKEVRRILSGNQIVIGYRCDIDQVRRIQNHVMHNRFINKATKMKKTSNEKVMWQRIHADFKDTIMETGCEKSFLEVKCDGLGDGICFASSVKDCITEDDVKSEDTFTLLQCKVFLGDEGKGKGQPGLRYPPMNENSNEPFSSVSNDNFSMVFSSAQVYPTHIIDIHFDEIEDQE